MSTCRERMTKCRRCGSVMPQARMGAPRKWCGKACAAAAETLGLTGHVCMDDPGPKYDVPLDGFDFQASERRREERIARVIAEGVPLAALRERFDCSEQVLRRVAELRGLTIHTGLAGGIPVLGA
ncbi:hypothetical protein [Corallococcus sp. AS-1-6]|uniref:hypothetical protein n=1 Tax=Corallococcus sp. AS-1-6 TaxID=2874599 RepID=UPI001CC06486|nr:hypothetical protein [Corallococcus sp. AS-1-6]MBZ4371457.1 hypothetical protein [Corallococcus sp. AS-1-6]